MYVLYSQQIFVQNWVKKYLYGSINVKNFN